MTIKYLTLSCDLIAQSTLMKQIMKQIKGTHIHKHTMNVNASQVSGDFLKTLIFSNLITKKPNLCSQKEKVPELIKIILFICFEKNGSFEN